MGDGLSIVTCTVQLLLVPDIIITWSTDIPVATMLAKRLVQILANSTLYPSTPSTLVPSMKFSHDIATYFEYRVYGTVHIPVDVVLRPTPAYCTSTRNTSATLVLVPSSRYCDPHCCTPVPVPGRAIQIKFAT